MRLLSLASLLMVCAGCTVPVPTPPTLVVSVKARARANVAVKTTAEVRPPEVTPPEVAPPAVVVEPTEPVPIQGAAVVEFFGIPLEGAQDVVFVLDRSGSMSLPAQGRLAQVTVAAPPADAPADVPPGTAPTEPAPAPAPPPAPTKIEVAHAELVDALRRLPAGTRMNVIFFNGEVDGYAAGMVPLEESQREELIAFVREMGADGSTALTPAMRIAFLMNARRIVLLSDGLGNVGGGSRVLLRDAREAMLGGVRIDTIGIGGDQDGSLLQTLAHESGGIYQAL